MREKGKSGEGRDGVFAMQGLPSFLSLETDIDCSCLFFFLCTPSTTMYTERQERWYVPHTTAHPRSLFPPPSPNTIILSAVFQFCFPKGVQDGTFFFFLGHHNPFHSWRLNLQTRLTYLNLLSRHHTAVIFTRCSTYQITSSNSSARYSISGEPQTCMRRPFPPDGLGCLFLAPFFSSSLAVNV